MKSLITKLAEAAAAAGAPQQTGPAQAGAQDPAMQDPAMMEPPDPIEEDNQRLSNILENLKLRQEVVTAQAELEEMARQTQKSTKGSADPDKPSKPKIIDNVLTASNLSQIMKNTPKIQTNRGELEAGSDAKASTKTKGKPETPGQAGSEILQNEPLPTTSGN